MLRPPPRSTLFPYTSSSDLQGFPQGQVVVGPAVNGVDAIATITTALPGIGRSGSQLIRILRETEIYTGPLPFRVPHHELPEQPPLAQPVLVELKPDNTAAFIALFESGALSE